ncbi:hypothetical protein [Streptomyces sp. V3I7]|uniref:hypothetical protein n=1 Tax=Streptomyces sp. V3I7 TaxID=3042278 RepID=UPI00278B7189|nr:hypothetical protein [Streptomyces sp. V3I7]MDQ0990468.1 hypothetical protein [Streptomyces sp. V3I7]
MSGSVRLPPGAVPDTVPYVPRQPSVPGWATPDPIGELALRFDDFVAAAVHPDEIAALLESDGLSDDQIRERYGVRNSFALAEELYDRVPRSHPEPEGPAPDPWRIGLLGCLLRGVVFALPGFAYVLGGPLLTGRPEALGLPAGTLPLLAGALAGWAWNQGLAHRAYVWLGLGDRTAARRCLLVGAPVGMLFGTLVALAVAGPGRPGAVAFAAGQSCYLGAAGVLLVMGRERVLLAALAPMAAGALLALVHPVPLSARLVLLLGPLATVAVLGLLEVAPVVKELGQGRWGAGLVALVPSRGRRFGRPWLADSLPYAAFGLGSGVLLVYSALGDVIAGEARSAVAAPAAVALTLSMGPAEWLLHRFRSGGLAGLRASGTARAFRRRTALTLVRCLAGFLLTLLALGLATSALWPHTPRLSGVRLADLLLLGVVLWTGLLLQSFGAVLGAAVLCCVAAAGQTAALLTHAAGPHWIALAAYGSAAAAQTGLVCGLLGRATAHR